METATPDVDVEEIRHRNRTKEIILDKLILALIVLVAGYGLNYRLTKYENALDSQLEKLKAAYNLDRILYERQITAHENTWKALIDFRQATRDHFRQKFDDDRNDEMLVSAAELISVTEFESLYLSPDAKAHVQKLYLEHFPEFRKKWREVDQGEVMSKATWTWWAGKIDAVGNVFANLVQTRRLNALESKPQTVVKEATADSPTG